METKSPHFWWIISALLVTIIGLISYIVVGKMDNTDFIMSYISCASVILSVTLSIFAILYTYISNAQIQQQFEKINTAAISINDTSNKLITTEQKLNNLLETIEKHLDNIDKSQKEMNQQIGNMNNQVDETTISNLQKVPK